MLGIAAFQWLLNGIGWILAELYKYVGSFGVSIILLTVLIRVVLLPLGIKQIKSMQAMQSIQPKIKEIQKKNKGNKAKIQEETMKLYKDAGVNPLGGCLPLLLQFPLLIAMYAVIRTPQLIPMTAGNVQVTGTQQVDHYAVHNSHLPSDSLLFQNVIEYDTGSFLGLNLQCAAKDAGHPTVPINDSQRQPVKQDIPITNANSSPLSFNTSTQSGTYGCGNSPISRAPYYLFLAAMIFTTYYQQRQMQKASPPGASTQQQQTIMKLMPIMFGVFGFTFPAGLVVYWTVANVWQIGQQYALLKLGHIGPDALEKRIAEQRAKGDQPAKKGLMSRFMESAEAERQKRGKDAPASTRKSPRLPSPGTPRRRPNTGKGGSSTKRTPPPKGTPPKEPRRKPGGDDDA